jgi:segregation and condensation protein B
MSDHHIRNVIEASLLAAGKPMSINEIGELFDEDGRPDKGQIQTSLEALAADYEDRGIELRETASGWRIQIRQSYAREVSRLWPERPQKYSRALLETLALIAYRQPITRAEIESVRGVAVNPNIVKTLMEREWIRVVGHRDVPGHPELLGTTRSFLDYFGLRTIDELPPLAEIKQMVDLNPQLTLPVPDSTEDSLETIDVTETSDQTTPDAESEVVAGSGEDNERA